jgi:hypothetical protein
VIRVDEGGVVILIFALLAFFGFIAWSARSYNQTRMHFFARLGTRWNGRAVEGGFWSNPMLELEVDGVAAQLTYHTGSRYEPAWTKVHFNWASRHRLRLRPEGFTVVLRSVFGGAVIRIGDPEFDPMFWIEGTDREWARTILTPAVRRGLLELRSTGTWFTSNDVTVDLGPTGLMLKVSRNLVDDQAYLESFVDLAVLILREMKSIAAVAVVVMAEVELRGGSECPVCGHAVESARTCPQCRTPHHEECWKYMGGCAIFACAGRSHGNRGAA